MKKKIISVILAVLLLGAAGAAFCFFSSDDGGAESLPPVEYVSGILDNPGCPEQLLLKRFDPSDRTGAVYVIGAKGFCDSLEDAFLSCEEFDNINGSMHPDGLPDFAGETVCTVVNFSDFRSLNESEDDSALRELAVRNVLAALDTVCHVSPYDPNGIGKKPLAKLIVLANPYVSDKGRYDVDTLLAACGSPVPLMDPVSLMVGEVRQASGKRRLTVGVVDKYNEGCYGNLLSPSDSCVQYSSLSGDDPLVEFLDRYVRDGHSSPLDALLLNDPGLDASAMRETVSRLTSVMNESSLTYGNLLSKDFRIVDARETITRAAYCFFRRNNLFTHFISQPKSMHFMVIPREENSRRIMFLQYNERFIPAN